MTNATVYTPVLRWKPAEQGALAGLTREQRTGIKPLIEIMPLPNGHVGGFATTVARSVIGAWGARRDFYVDFSRVAGKVPAAHVLDCLDILSSSGSSAHVALPLVRSGLSDAIRHELAEHERKSVALRVNNSDLVSLTLQRDLLATLSALRRHPEDVDILLDFGSMTDGTSMQRTGELVARSASWSSVTLIGGSFPSDLTGLSKNSQYLLPRQEWLAWESLNLRAIPSRCAFGDYTVIAADYREPPAKANFSASIRYTTRRDFVVMRGEGVFNDEGPGFNQYPAQAQMLKLRTEYCGPGFSAGDRYIYDMSLQRTKTGSAQSWLRAGVNHHVVFVRQQLAA